MFGVLFELLIYIFCQRDADLKPLLHTVTAFPVSAGERGGRPKACCCIYSLHLTGGSPWMYNKRGSLVELRVWLQTEFTPSQRGRVEGVIWDWAIEQHFKTVHKRYETEFPPNSALCSSVCCVHM